MEGRAARVVVLRPQRTSLLIAHIVSGALMALFVAPAVVEHWLRGDGIRTQRGVAAVIGVAGPLLAEVAIRAIQRRGDQVADRLVDRVTGPEEK